MTCAIYMYNIIIMSCDMQAVDIYSNIVTGHVRVYLYYISMRCVCTMSRRNK